MKAWLWQQPVGRQRLSSGAASLVTTNESVPLLSSGGLVVATNSQREVKRVLNSRNFTILSIQTSNYDIK